MRTTTRKAATKRGVHLKSRVKAGAPSVSEIVVSKPVDDSSTNLFHNHSQAIKGLRVKSRVKAGSLNFTKITY
jgi:hypothetical protein